MPATCAPTTRTTRATPTSSSGTILPRGVGVWGWQGHRAACHGGHVQGVGSGAGLRPSPTDTFFPCSPGSVIVQCTQLYRQTNTSLSAKSIALQLAEKSNNEIKGLQIKDVQGEQEPRWGLSIPVWWELGADILCSCCRSRRGNLDLFSLQDSYHPMTEYPTYHTHGRYMAPVTKPNPYSEVSGNGSRALSYTNPALSSENL
uniref:Uncharacterized protein n=1 Tax=Crocodylus porosus TaxID=8502 RepID=A0A7M4E3G9_CROPO